MFQIFGIKKQTHIYHKNSYVCNHQNFKFFKKYSVSDVWKRFLNIYFYNYV